MKREIKDFIQLIESKKQNIPEIMGHQDGSSKRQIHSTTCLRKIPGELSQ